MAFVAISACIMAQPTPAEITIAGSHDPITVDGYNDEVLWDDIDVWTLPYEIVAETKAPLTDFNAEFQLAWNFYGLMFYGEITDDVHHFMTGTETSWWLRDFCEIVTCTGAYGETGSTYSWGPEQDTTSVEDSTYSKFSFDYWDPEDSITIAAFWKGHWAAANAIPVGAADTAINVVIIKSMSGWSIEGVIPWALYAMANEPASGMKMGFDIGVGDADEGDKDHGLSLLNDSGEDQVYQNKRYLNTAILGNLEPIGVEHSLTNRDISIYVVDNILKIKGNVQSLRIYSITGQSVLYIQDLNTTTIDVSKLQSGVYVVIADDVFAQKVIITK